MRNGLNRGALPRMRPTDIDAAWALIAAVGADKTTKDYLAELVEGKLAHDEARTAAEAATAESKEREAAAREAEDSATKAKAELSVETTMALQELARRELVVKELERDADERDTTLRERVGNVAWREELLTKAGVVFSTDED